MGRAVLLGILEKIFPDIEPLDFLEHDAKPQILRRKPNSRAHEEAQRYLLIDRQRVSASAAAVDASPKDREAKHRFVIFNDIYASDFLYYSRTPMAVRISTAEAIYRKSLDAEPSDKVALHGIAMLALYRKRHLIKGDHRRQFGSTTCVGH